MLSKHPLLAKVLTSPDDQSNVIRLNQLLAEIRTMTQASDIYLINSAGITVSASNYQLDTSFIGMDFTFRPYFQQAMQGGLSRYYAVGLSSAKRGFYYAYPVIAQGDIVGVIALKISIAQIEQQYKKTLLTDSFNFLIVAPDDVVFISDREEWRLKTMVSYPRANVQDRCSETLYRQEYHSP